MTSSSNNNFTTNNITAGLDGVNILTSSATFIDSEISAGAAKTNFGVFLLASVLGRTIRFFAVGTLIFFFGEKIKGFIDRYFNLLMIVFMVLLIGGFLIIKYIF